MPKPFYRGESDGFEIGSVVAVCLILDASRLDAGCVLSAVLAHALGEIYVYSCEADEEIEG